MMDQRERTSKLTYLAHLFRGARIIAKWEFIHNLKTIRMLVLILIFSLVMLGGSYGISLLLKPPADITLDIPSDVISQAMGNSFVSVHVLNLDNDEYANDVIIYTFKGNGRVESGLIFKVFETWEVAKPDGVNLTDDNGMSIYYDLPPAEYQVVVIERGVSANFTIVENHTTVPINIALAPVFDIELGEIKLSGDPDLLDFLPKYRQVGAIVHVVDENGVWVEGAAISVGDENVGLTNTTGTLSIELEPGKHIVKASLSGVDSYPVETFVPEPGEVEKDDETLTGLPVHLGPDFVIIVVASIASFVVSLSAIVLSFDAITKERVEKSLDVLLTKPFPRESVVLGKYLGITGSMTAPFVLVLFGAVWIMSAVSNKWPTPEVIYTFIIFIVLLIAIYVALEILVSILARTTGTAILSGIGIWVLLNMLWGVMSLGISELFDLELVSVSNYMSLLNPSDLFLVCLSIISTDALIASMGLEEVKEVLIVDYAFAKWVFFLAFGLWIVISLGLATFIFRKKEDL